MTNYPDEILKEVESKTWFHRFELLPGLTSPGRLDVDPPAALNTLGVPRDLTGKRVIDIGALDGAYSVEFAKRGADVLAVDIQDPDRTGFNVTRKLKEVKIDYVTKSVYDLNPEELGKFDLVWYWGVFYHLKEPMIGFRRIFDIMESDGILYYEGAILDYAYTYDASLEPYKDALKKTKDLPLTYFTSGAYAGDSSNWYVPNAACLKEWLTTAGFQNISMIVNKRGSRALGSAEKNPDSWIAAYEYPSY